MLLLMIQSGYTFKNRASLRGFQDFWVFDPPKINCKEQAKPEVIGLLLHRQNGIRIYGTDSKRQLIGSWLDNLIDDLWEPGIILKNGSVRMASSSDKDEAKSVFYEIRMHSSPWWMSEWDKDGQLNARFLVSRILGCLELIGYQFIADVNLYRSQYDKAFLLFRYFLVSL
ncbi:hypothetical protein Ciccas_011185 [Cichlidogyrus casuarinus]|uniref:Uncharacterized protein n=1 Tax=Cichlidogyrus casuarinus TaxID=1844966 RepID=A0ABD2PRZ2_9PLAT